MKLFLDANVLIDFILERQDFYLASATIMSYADEGQVDICVSSLSVVTANFICVERCKMPVEIFRKKVDFLREFMEVCSVDASDIYHSYDNKWSDFEDGVQNYSAKRADADFIVTRNIKDFEEHGIKVLSVEDVCRILMQTYKKQ